MFCLGASGRGKDEQPLSYYRELNASRSLLRERGCHRSMKQARDRLEYYDGNSKFRVTMERVISRVAYLAFRGRMPLVRARSEV